VRNGPSPILAAARQLNTAATDSPRDGEPELQPVHLDRQIIGGRLRLPCGPKKQSGEP
jgi:hypothetical protein